MHIIHSMLREVNPDQQTDITADNSEIALRYQAYMVACQKYQREIEAIQKYLPGWMPAFNR